MQTKETIPKPIINTLETYLDIYSNEAMSTIAETTGDVNKALIRVLTLVQRHTANVSKNHISKPFIYRKLEAGDSKVEGYENKVEEWMETSLIHYTEEFRKQVLSLLEKKDIDTLLSEFPFICSFLIKCISDFQIPRKLKAEQAKDQIESSDIDNEVVELFNELMEQLSSDGDSFNNWRLVFFYLSRKKGFENLKDFCLGVKIRVGYSPCVSKLLNHGLIIKSKGMRTSHKKMVSWLKDQLEFYAVRNDGETLHKLKILREAQVYIEELKKSDDYQIKLLTKEKLIWRLDVLETAYKYLQELPRTGIIVNYLIKSKNRLEDFV